MCVVICIYCSNILQHFLFFEILFLAACAPEESTSNKCTAIDGTVRFFLSNPGRFEEAMALAGPMVRDIVADPSFVHDVGTGLIKITLLESNGNGGGDTDGDGDATDDDEGIFGQGSDKVIEGETGFGTFSFVIVAIGSAALVAFVGSVYYWKRGNSDGPDGAATQAAGTSMLYQDQSRCGDDDLLSESLSTHERPSSPFSEMLPSAYRFNDNMSILTGQGGMSPVFEADACSDSSGGFASEHDTSLLSFEQVDNHNNSSNNSNNIHRYGASSPILLGARARDGGELTAGHHMSDTDTSSMEDGMAPAAAASTTANPFDALLGLAVDDTTEHDEMFFSPRRTERDGDVDYSDNGGMV